MTAPIPTLLDSSLGSTSLVRVPYKLIEGNCKPRLMRRVDVVGIGSRANTVGRGPIDIQQRLNVRGDVLTGEGGGEFDFWAAMKMGDVDGLNTVQRNTNGYGVMTGAEKDKICR